ncbi:MAG: hypothetical protein HY922_17395 [Elusimicrobia bacterium]|nr:hypothetical protein [Elusimicrobiota bacterium]
MGKKAGEIRYYLDRLPYFRVDNLKIFGLPLPYLRVMLSRFEAQGAIIRLKRGVYAARAYCERMKAERRWSAYLEFLSGKIYSPAYLSLDYVLYANNILTEAPVNFTLVAGNKTAFYKNAIGSFSYHKVKAALFCGYETRREGEFPINKASKAKALFDFLYLRRNLLRGRNIFMELRLNLDGFGKGDLAEFKRYALLSGSRRMRELHGWIGKCSKI